MGRDGRVCAARKGDDRMPANPQQAALLYLAVVNGIAAAVTAADKGLAALHRRRVPEATLLLIAAFGGAAAMLPTMLLIRHKTRKWKFMLGLPLILLLQCAAALTAVGFLSGRFG